MSVGRQYLIGTLVVALAGVGMVLGSPPSIRTQVGWGALAGLLLQAPLGWWAVQALGTDRFFLVWGLGILTRLTLVGGAGLALLPRLGWSPAPALGAMVAVLGGLLLLEGYAAFREQAREDEK